jgi:hypothetical protein
VKGLLLLLCLLLLLPVPAIECMLSRWHLATVGVAMGNAGAKVKGVADAVVGSNDEDGVAQAIHEYVLKPRGLSEGAAAVAVPPVAAAAAGH